MTIFDAIDELDFDEVERLIDADGSLITARNDEGQTLLQVKAESLRLSTKVRDKKVLKNASAKVIATFDKDIEILTPLVQLLTEREQASMSSPQAAAAAEQPPALSQQSIFAQQCQQFLQGHALSNQLEEEHLQELKDNDYEAYQAMDKVLEGCAKSGPSC